MAQNKNNGLVRVGGGVRRRYMLQLGRFQLTITAKDFYSYSQLMILQTVKERESYTVVRIADRYRGYVDQIIGDLHIESRNRDYAPRAVAQALQSWLGRMIRERAMAA